MLIDSFEAGWLEALEADDSLLLLIDGAFVPGLHRKFAAPIMLFERLPGFDDSVRDVSPFIVPFSAAPTMALRLCDGWPMVSAINAPLEAAELAARLAPWCVVKVDQQYLNLRFPDTRRLPNILQSLSEQQRAQLIGPIERWRYIGRDGRWHEADVTPGDAAPADEPELDASQFAQLVDSSEADALLAQASYLNIEPRTKSKALQYSIANSALDLGRGMALTADLGEWCHACLAHAASADEKELLQLFDQWKAGYAIESAGK